MGSLISRISNKAGPHLLRTFLKVERRTDCERLGSDYGGWVVPTSLLSESSICYCAGVGEDISFDLALIERFGCEVFAFDPTPRASAYVSQNAGHIPKYRYFDFGLWSEDARRKFYAPRDPSHVSHSIVNLQRTATFFEADCRRLSSIMRELNHSRLDLLKLDIEGAEFEVLNSMIEDGVDATVLCIEFDQPAALTATFAMVRRLVKYGFRLVNIDRWDYTFVRADSP